MVLGFRTQWGNPPRPTQFEQKIIDGLKKHTLREDAKNRWKAGNSIQFVVGNRTKYRRQFMAGECTGTQTVLMADRGPGFVIKIGYRFLDLHEIEQFALNDGFVSLSEFEAWFRPLIKMAPGKVLTLKLIHWTDLRY